MHKSEEALKIDVALTLKGCIPKASILNRLSSLYIFCCYQYHEAFACGVSTCLASDMNLKPKILIQFGNFLTLPVFRNKFLST
jgi:hypothetical protein